MDNKNRRVGVSTQEFSIEWESSNWFSMVEKATTWRPAGDTSVRQPVCSGQSSTVALGSTEEWRETESWNTGLVDNCKCSGQTSRVWLHHMGLNNIPIKADLHTLTHLRQELLVLFSKVIKKKEFGTKRHQIQ